MEHLAAVVLGEHADSHRLFPREARHPIVVEHLLSLHLLRSERHVVVAAEVVAESGHPLEAPSHALLEGVQLLEPGLGSSDEGHVTMGEVDGDAVEVIGPKGAVWTSLVPARMKHEVIHDQLASPVEELR